MKREYIIFCIIALLVLMLVGGCPKRSVITTNLTNPIEHGSACVIGVIGDGLPEGTKEEDKPSIEDINNFKMHILEETNKRGTLSVALEHKNPRYIISGTILEFEKPGLLEKGLIVFKDGITKMVVNLRLTDQISNENLFAGNFSFYIASGQLGRDQVFERLAKDFAKELEKQQKSFK